jgi:hypothetical protein
MTEQITYSLNSYRALQEALKDPKAVGEICDDFRPAANLAYSKLSSIFGQQTEFSKDWLSDFSEGSHQRILSQLLSWLRAIPWYKGKDQESDVRSVRVQSAERCRAAIKKLLKDGNWVFVKIIR